MKSAELATEVEKIVKEAQSRITGVGANQYAMGDLQKFETMSLDDLLEYMVEELLDQINYSVMNLLRLRWLQKAVTVIGHETVSPGNIAFLAAHRSKVSEAMFGKSVPQPVEG